MHKNFVVGIDIGYSNLNICMGNQGEAAVTKILPACAVHKHMRWGLMQRFPNSSIFSASQGVKSEAS